MGRRDWIYNPEEEAKPIPLPDYIKPGSKNERNYDEDIDNDWDRLYSENVSTDFSSPYSEAEKTRQVYAGWYDGDEPGYYGQDFGNSSGETENGTIYTDPETGESFYIAPDGTVTPMKDFTTDEEAEAFIASLDAAAKQLKVAPAFNGLISNNPDAIATEAYQTPNGKFTPLNMLNGEKLDYGIKPVSVNYSDKVGEDNDDHQATGDELVQTWKNSTKRGDLDGFLSVALGTYKDKKGIYHISQDSWQKYMGYNSIYDDVFRASSSMNSETFTFEYEGYEYMIWAWKGDYINLGAGAELGIYTRSKFNNEYGDHLDHWPADPSHAMPMTMTLYYNGEPMITYDPNSDEPDNPDKKKWWLNAFDPQHQGIDAGKLTATYTINFSKFPELYEAFIQSEDYIKSRDKWSISEENKYLLTFTFSKEKET